MSKTLPLEIRRKYTVKTEKDHWSLKCDVCNQMWELKRPKKGHDIHAGNILALLEHAASHPLPNEEVSEKLEPQVEVVPEPPPTSQVKVHKRKTVGPLDYSVEWFGSPTLCHLVKVSLFKDPDYKLHDEVLRVADNHYKVVIRAANQKHAQLVGERLIHKYFNQQKASM